MENKRGVEDEEKKKGHLPSELTQKPSVQILLPWIYPHTLLLRGDQEVKHSIWKHTHETIMYTNTHT